MKRNLAQLIIISFVWFLSLGGTAQGAVTFDAVSQSSGVTSSLTFSHTTSGSDRILVVCGATGGTDISTVTYAGTSMTNHAENPGPAIEENEMWKLASPTSGANNVVITQGISDNMAGGAVSFNGSDGTLGTAATTAALSTAATDNGVDVTSATDDLVIDCFVNTGTGTPTATGTLRANPDCSGSSCRLSMQTKAGATTVRMAYDRGTVDSGYDFSILAASVKQGTQAVAGGAKPKIIIEE